MIIDVEHHAATADRLQPANSKSGQICERYWDANGKMKVRSSQEASRLERHLQFMDEAGIDMALLTSMPVTTLEQCKKWNDYCGFAIKTYPQRFIGCASILPLGGQPAIQELERAVTELGLRGVHIFTQNGGRFLDSRELWLFYEKVSDLHIPIDVHVTLDPSGFDALYASYALYYVMARELDMCTATFRLCLGGVLEEFPDLIFIMNHFGGGISAVCERLDAYVKYIGIDYPSIYTGKPLISKPWRYYFDKLYFNIAGCESGMASLKSALTTIGPKRLMFATDWPFNYERNPKDVQRYIKEIRELPLRQEDIDAMLGGAAAELFGI
jgi:2,3-dihydroxybenzoate decarboxylase